MPNTSSWMPIPGSKLFSASSRSFVALSRSKMSPRCVSSSAIRASTLSPPSEYFEGTSRCVSFRRTRFVRGRLTCHPAERRQVGEQSASPGAALDHVGKRRLSTKDAVGVSPLDPGVGELLGVENVERLEDADEIGDAH